MTLRTLTLNWLACFPASNLSFLLLLSPFHYRKNSYATVHLSRDILTQEKLAKVAPYGIVTVHKLILKNVQWCTLKTLCESCMQDPAVNC